MCKMKRIFGLMCLTATVGIGQLAAQVSSVTCSNNASTDASTLNSAILSASEEGTSTPNYSNGQGQGPQIQIHGICLVNATVVLYGSMSYVGDSRSGTIIRQAPGANLSAVVADYSWTSNSAYGDNSITVAHLTIDGNKSNNSSGIGLVARSWNSNFEDLQIENTFGDGLLFSNAASNGTTLLASGSNMVNDHFQNIFIINPGANGFHESDNGSSGSNLTDGFLTEVEISDPAASAIMMDNSAGWVIRANHVYAVAAHAIQAGRCFGTTIEDNYIENFGQPGTSGTTYFGIQCAIESGPGSIIANNKIFQINGQGSGTYYFIDAKLVSGTGYVNALGNLLTGASTNDTGLYYENTNGAGTMLNYVSTGNQVSLMTTPIKHDTYTTAATSY